MKTEEIGELPPQGLREKNFMNPHSRSLKCSGQKVVARRRDFRVVSAACGLFSFLLILSSVSEHTTPTGSVVALTLAAAFGLAAWALGSRRGGIRIRIDN
ncbi:hypothetical protein IPJ70_03745 [Candidatus Campbellbacteria bacterium]|nr:MAG: hypothetical protein IPJ70_03745 [Candidatus Campbellbacteria bacterium]